MIMQNNSFRSYYRPYADGAPSYSSRNPTSGQPSWYDPNDYLGGPNYMDLANGPNYFSPNTNSGNYINMSSSSNTNIRVQQARYIPHNHSNNSLRPVPNNIQVSLNSNNVFKPSTNTSSTVTTAAVSSPLQTSPDETRLTVLKAVMQRTQERLTRLAEEKKRIENEEQRLQKVLLEHRSEVDRIEGRVRDPRLKNRPSTTASNQPSFSNCTRAATTATTLAVSIGNSSSSSCSYSSANTFTNSMPTTNVGSALGFLLTTNPVLSLSSSSSTTTTPVITSVALVPPAQTSNVTSTVSLAPATFVSQNVFRPNSVPYQPPPPRFIPTISSPDTTTVTSTSILNPAQLILPISPVNNQVSTSTPNSLTSSSPSVDTRSLLNKPRLAQNKQGPVKVTNQHGPSKGKQLGNLVQFKPLPLIYDCFAEDIVEPKSYSDPRKKLNCVLKAPQVTNIINPNSGKRILLRICIIKTKKTSQSDRVPRKLQIKINGRLISSTKNTTGSIKAPLDITSYFAPQCGTVQEIELVWPENEPVKDYGVGVFLAQRLPIEQTLALLQTKDYLRPTLDTIKLIKQNYANTSDICSEDITISLLCPITKQRIEYPCIGTKCEHLVCFDAKSFLNVYRQKAEWHCPTCKKVIGYNDLRLDGLIQEVLSTAPSDCYRITIDQNGKWEPLTEAKYEGSDCSTVIDDPKSKIDIITLDDSDDERLTDNNEPSEALNTSPAPKSPSEKSLPEDVEEEVASEILPKSQKSVEVDYMFIEGEENEEEEEEEDEEEDEEDADEETDEEEATDEESEESEDLSSKSEGEITDESDIDYHPRVNKRNCNTSQDDDIRPPLRSRTNRKRQLQDIFGTDDSSPENTSRRRKRRNPRRKR